MGTSISSANGEPFNILPTQVFWVGTNLIRDNHAPSGDVAINCLDEAWL